MMANDAAPGPPERRSGADANVEPAARNPLSHTQQPRQRVLRVRITDVDTGRLKVGLTLPAGLVSVALRQGARLLPQAQSAFDLVGAIERNGLASPYVVDDVQNGERVEISLE